MSQSSESRASQANFNGTKHGISRADFLQFLFLFLCLKMPPIFLTCGATRARPHSARPREKAKRRSIGSILTKRKFEMSTTGQAKKVTMAEEAGCSSSGVDRPFKPIEVSIDCYPLSCFPCARGDGRTMAPANGIDRENEICFVFSKLFWPSDGFGGDGFRTKLSSRRSESLAGRGNAIVCHYFGEEGYDQSIRYASPASSTRKRNRHFF